MLLIKSHNIIAIRKNNVAKIHIKYLKDGVGKSICGRFSEHNDFIIDSLEEGVESLQAILEEKDMCTKCSKPIKKNVEAFKKGLEYALNIVWVEQSWNYKKICFSKIEMVERASGDHPAFIMATKGQKLVVLDNGNSFWDYKVQDINKEYPPFYVMKSEVRFEEDELLSIVSKFYEE